MKANKMIKEAIDIASENFPMTDNLTKMQYLEMCLRTVMFVEDMKNRREVAKLQLQNVKMTFKEDK